MAACLAAALLVCMLAGALGPAMLSVQNGGTEELVVDKHGRTELVLDVHGFNPMNQFYWIDVEFRPRSGILYEQINSVDITLNVTGSNALVLFDGDRHIVQNRVFSRAVTCTKKKCEKFFLFGQRQIFFESLKSKFDTQSTAMFPPLILHMSLTLQSKCSSLTRTLPL